MYNSKVATTVADRLFTTPIAVERLITNYFFNIMKARDHERFDNLEKVGFKIAHKEEFVHTIYERLGKHYLDVGASAKISKGLVRS